MNQGTPYFHALCTTTRASSKEIWKNEGKNMCLAIQQCFGIIVTNGNCLACNYPHIVFKERFLSDNNSVTRVTKIT